MDIYAASKDLILTVFSRLLSIFLRNIFLFIIIYSGFDTYDRFFSFEGKSPGSTGSIAIEDFTRVHAVRIRTSTTRICRYLRMHMDAVSRDRDLERECLSDMTHEARSISLIRYQAS